MCFVFGLFFFFSILGVKLEAGMFNSSICRVRFRQLQSSALSPPAPDLRNSDPQRQREYPLIWEIWNWSAIWNRFMFSASDFFFFPWCVSEESLSCHSTFKTRRTHIGKDRGVREAPWGPSPAFTCLVAADSRPSHTEKAPWGTLTHVSSESPGPLSESSLLPAHKREQRQQS